MILPMYTQRELEEMKPSLDILNKELEEITDTDSTEYKQKLSDANNLYEIINDL